jgi:glucosamine--fructose-6-phosphate aminotransferase (isomerizing)
MTSTMAREIAEQPAATRATLQALAPRLDELSHAVAGCTRVRFYARGSSDAAAVYGRHLVEAYACLPAALASPSIATLYGVEHDLSGTLAVFLSQSGATEEIVANLRWASGCGATTVAVTNDEASPLTRAADVAWTTRAGTEHAVPATKTYTSQLVALALLGAALRRSRQEPNEDLLAALSDVPSAIEEMLVQRDLAEQAAALLKDRQVLVVTGRGYTSSAAHETALKIAETTYRPALGMSAADLEHGPIAVLDADSALVVVAPEDGPARDSLASVARTAAARGSLVLGLGGGPALERHCRLRLTGPRLPEPVAPAALVVGGQLVAEALCRADGLDPDQPRGLSKVTQTS